jgi:anti-sigma regulatory factor (Ser/Thr protein kinase)
MSELSDHGRDSRECGHYASTELASDPAAAAEARRFTRACLPVWGMEALTEDAVAVVSELAANAVNAVSPGTSGLEIIVALHAVPPELRISVWDVGPGHPAPADADPSAETGRGLTIIDALTHSNWGWWPTPRSGGKVVHATLTVPASRRRPAAASTELRRYPDDVPAHRQPLP